MKKLIVFLLVLNTVFSSAILLRQRLKRSSDTDSSDLETTIEAFNFSQKLDHFHLDDNEEWNQRYWISRTHYKSGGPAFLLVLGESEADSRYFNQSWVSYAKKLRAFCFLLEHRFYGESWPRKYMRHQLNIAQVLADIAYFIKAVTIKFQLPKGTKWILFGCSYAGRLAAWARLKYPHLVHGAVASSTSLLSKVNRYDYLQNDENSLKSYNPKCLESITRAVEEMAHFFKHTKNDEKNSHGEMKIALLQFILLISYAAQYNDTITFNIPTVCNFMINHNGTKIAAFIQLVNMKYGSENSIDENSIVKNFTAENYSMENSALGNSTVNNSAVTDSGFEHSAAYYVATGTNAWSYQECSELGGFINCNATGAFSAVSHLVKVEHVIRKSCEFHYGVDYGVEKLNKKVIHTNVLYGGLDFNAANTLFIHGSTDPFHTSGLYKTTDGSLYETIFINGTSHCSDYHQPSEKDIPALKNAREKTLKIIEKWLKT